MTEPLPQPADAVNVTLLPMSAMLFRLAPFLSEHEPDFSAPKLRSVARFAACANVLALALAASCFGFSLQPMQPRIIEMGFHTTKVSRLNGGGAGWDSTHVLMIFARR